MKKIFTDPGLLLFALGILAIIALTGACGSLGDIFGGQDNLPVSGVWPWGKIDYYNEYELTQPFILLSDENTEYIEPFLMETNNGYRIYFEIADFEEENGIVKHVRSQVFLAESKNSVDWEIANEGNPVLAADVDWENGFVGAPTVAVNNGRHVMLYGGNRGAGIGRATSDDGITWAKEETNPVISPDQKWEGGEFGSVISPSIVIDKGITHVWYGGGQAGHGAIDLLMGQSIGYARSENGLDFVKMDSVGRTSLSQPGRVEPVLNPKKKWEGNIPKEALTGAVGMPGVFLDDKSDRPVFRMYYSGNRIGDMYSDNVSIGYAGSFDGIEFVRADDRFSPIVTEIFVLTLSGISDMLAYDEFSASVIRNGENSYLMAFSQVDSLNWLSYGLKGIALASCPPPK